MVDRFSKHAIFKHSTPSPEEKKKKKQPPPEKKNGVPRRSLKESRSFPLTEPGSSSTKSSKIDKHFVSYRCITLFSLLPCRTEAEHIKLFRITSRISYRRVLDYYSSDPYTQVWSIMFPRKFLLYFEAWPRMSRNSRRSQRIIDPHSK